MKILILLFTFFSSLVFADEISLSDLQKLAEINHSSVHEAMAGVLTADATLSASRANHYPELGFEGGFESNQHQSQKNSNLFGYAYGRYQLLNSGKDFIRSSLAQVDNEFQKNILLATQTQSVREVTEKFFRILALKEELKSHEYFLKLNTEHLQMANKKARSGITSLSDPMEFEIRQSELQNEIELTKNEILELQKNLNTKLSGTENSPLSDNTTFNGSFVIDPLLEKDSPDIFLLSQEVASPVQLENAKNQFQASFQSSTLLMEYLPQISFEVDYGKLNNEKTYFNERPEVALKALVTLPLFTGLSSKKSIEEKTELSKLYELKEQHFRQNLKSEIKNDIEKSKIFSNQLKIIDLSLQKSKKYLELTLKEYQKGIKNAPDLSSATERTHSLESKLIDTKLQLSLIHAKYLTIKK